MATAWVPLQYQTLGSATSSVTFSSIPTGYRDLAIAIVGTSTTGPVDMKMQFNGDTGTNYAYSLLSGTGVSPQAAASTAQTAILLNYNVQIATSGPGMWEVQVLDYAATDKHKTALVRANASASTAAVDAVAGRWANTAAITSVTLFPAATTFTTQCTFALYGIAG